MTDIIIQSHDIWDYCIDHEEELKNVSHIVATNKDYGVEVLVSVEDDETPYVSVQVDDEEIYGKYMTNRVQAHDIMSEIYEKYLYRALETMSGLIGEEKESDDDDEELDEEEEIREREKNLDDAILYLYSEVTGDDTIFPGKELENVLNDLKEHFLEYMARKHNLEVYRPMFLYKEDGEKYFTEYPYEEIIFEDEDNPLYK